MPSTPPTYAVVDPATFEHVGTVADLGPPEAVLR